MLGKRAASIVESLRSNTDVTLTLGITGEYLLNIMPVSVFRIPPQNPHVHVMLCSSTDIAN